VSGAPGSRPPPVPAPAPVRWIDTLTEALGRVVALAAPLMVLVTCTVVVLRYGVEVGSIALQESVMYLHGALFLLALGYGLKNGSHVRVDLLYARLTPRGRTIVDLVGHLVFSLPLAVFVVWITWAYVAQAWSIGERSAEVGGLDYVWLLKTLIPVGAGLYGLQTLAEIVRCVHRLLQPPPDGFRGAARGRGDPSGSRSADA
jgi:TRAP-type mannitol/chloroaromatic compound transport system permease small subunit